MTATFTLEYWKEDDWYIGRVREVPGVFSQGETLDELEANILDAYQLMVEDSAQVLPKGTQTKLIELSA